MWMIGKERDDVSNLWVSLFLAVMKSELSRRRSRRRRENKAGSMSIELRRVDVADSPSRRKNKVRWCLRGVGVVESSNRRKDKVRWCLRGVDVVESSKPRVPPAPSSSPIDVARVVS